MNMLHLKGCLIVVLLGTIFPVTRGEILPCTLCAEPLTELTDYFSFRDYDPGNLNEVFRIRLEFDRHRFLRTRSREKYQPAVLSFTGTNGETVKKEVRIRTRGNFRKSYCDFPPVRISFSGKNDTLSPPVPAMKMVTHCRAAGNFEQYLLKEYLAYRLYNLLTDNSFRTRLLQVEYADSRGRMKPVIRYAFLIESEKQIEKRLHGRFLEKKEISMVKTDYENCQILALFQYMIGNTDWSIIKQHNVEILGPEDEQISRPLPIPYDFDYCGLVNAHYAVPHKDVGIATVRERKYMGVCLQEQEFLRFFDLFLEKKPVFMQMISSFELLEEREREDVAGYLEEFYEMIGDKNHVKMRMMRECLGS